MGLEAMLSIGQNPEKTSVDGDKKTPLYFEEFFLQISVDSINSITQVILESLRYIYFIC